MLSEWMVIQGDKGTFSNLGGGLVLEAIMRIESLCSVELHFMSKICNTGPFDEF